MAKSKWWLFRSVEGKVHEMTFIEETESKRDLDQIIKNEIEKTGIAPERLLRIFGREVPIQVKKTYK